MWVLFEHILLHTQHLWPRKVFQSLFKKEETLKIREATVSIMCTFSCRTMQWWASRVATVLCDASSESHHKKPQVTQCPSLSGHPFRFTPPIWTAKSSESRVMPHTNHMVSPVYCPLGRDWNLQTRFSWWETALPSLWTSTRCQNCDLLQIYLRKIFSYVHLYYVHLINVFSGHCLLKINMLGQLFYCSVM